MACHSTILLVEDSEDDIFLMRRALAQAHVTNPLHIVEDGEEAVDYLNGTGKFADRISYPLPTLIFLDLKLPLKSGHEVLSWIRGNSAFNSTVVVILTSSNEQHDISKSYALGANSYLVKPPTSEQLLDMAKSFKWYWLEYNRFASPNRLSSH
jgi:CheY-like chemotaxis protein